MKEKRSKEEKAAAGALLLVGERATGRLRDAARAATLALASKAGKSALLGALLAGGRAFGAKAGDELARARAEARTAARRRAEAELGAIGVAATLRQVPAAREAADAALATMTGESLAAQWRASVLVAYREAERKELPLASAIKRAEKTIEPRLLRAAMTESAQAFADEHREAVAEVVRDNPELARRIMREWSAMIDACERCRPHDGERVGWDESFEGGDEPGDMHPHCQCVETIVEA